MNSSYHCEITLFDHIHLLILYLVLKMYVSEPADSLCYCGSDVNPPIPAAIPLADKVEELVRELTISPSNTSAATRKKTCAEDSRPSAAGVGYVGAALLCSILGGLVLLDLSTLFQGIQKMRSLFKKSL